jgi:DNA-binding response OmpR family regulator
VIERRGHAVLCIGNDPVNLNSRCALLAEHGWKVISSGSGHEGIIRFGQEVVDVVIVDLDGSEAALITGERKRLRPKVPVIILVTDEKAVANGATQQANAVVLKSQEARSLLGALKAVLPPP